MINYSTPDNLPLIQERLTRGLREIITNSSAPEDTEAAETQGEKLSRWSQAIYDLVQTIKTGKKKEAWPTVYTDDETENVTLLPEDEMTSNIALKRRRVSYFFLTAAYLTSCYFANKRCHSDALNPTQKNIDNRTCFKDQLPFVSCIYLACLTAFEFAIFCTTPLAFPRLQTDSELDNMIKDILASDSQIRQNEDAELVKSFLHDETWSATSATAPKEHIPSLTKSAYGRSRGYGSGGGGGAGN